MKIIATLVILMSANFAVADVVNTQGKCSWYWSNDIGKYSSILHTSLISGANPTPEPIQDLILKSYSLIETTNDGSTDIEEYKVTYSIQGAINVKNVFIRTYNDGAGDACWVDSGLE